MSFHADGDDCEDDEEENHYALDVVRYEGDAEAAEGYGGRGL